MREDLYIAFSTRLTRRNSNGKKLHISTELASASLVVFLATLGHLPPSPAKKVKRPHPKEEDPSVRVRSHLHGLKCLIIGILESKAFKHKHTCQLWTQKDHVESPTVSTTPDKYTKLQQPKAETCNELSCNPDLELYSLALVSPILITAIPQDSTMLFKPGHSAHQPLV